MKNIILSIGLFLLLPFTAFCQNRIISGSFFGNYDGDKSVFKDNVSNPWTDGQNRKNLYVGASYLQKVSKNWFAGGQISFQTSTYVDYRLTLNTNVVSNVVNSKNVSIQFSGLARSNYFKKGDFTLFGTHSIGYEASEYTTKNNMGKFKSNSNALIISSGLGVNYEINPHWFLITHFGYLGYEFVKNKDLNTSETNNTSRFYTNFGLSSFGIGAEYHF